MYNDLFTLDDRTIVPEDSWLNLNSFNNSGCCYSSVRSMGMFSNLKSISYN
jgi:hypothetical protein